VATLKRGRSLSVSLTKLLQQVHIDADQAGQASIRDLLTAIGNVGKR
jgi:hypothetical protein